MNSSTIQDLQVFQRPAASAATESTEVTPQLLDKVSHNLTRAATCIKNWSSQLRTVYFTDSTLLSPDVLASRRLLYTECSMYALKIFPTAIALFETVKDTLECYTDLDLATFCEEIEEIRQCCLDHSKTAAKVQLGHIFVLVNLKAHENKLQADVGVQQFWEKTYREASVTKKESGAKLKRLGTFGLAAGPAFSAVDGGLLTFIGSVASALAIMTGDKRTTEAVHLANLANVASKNAEIFMQLIGSLQEFSEVVDNIAILVSRLESELRQMSKIGVGERVRRAHYLKMKGKGKRLIESCNEFLAVMPAIVSDLQSINRYSEKIDSEYANKWEARYAQFLRDGGSDRIKEIA